jgi:hypothetical protein
MSENFKETVNLRERMAEMEEKRKPVLKKKVNKAEDIDRLYETGETKKNTEFRKMNRPKNEGQNSNPYKGLVFVLIVVVAALSYFSFFNKGVSTNQETITVEEKWYSIKLNNDETFYGLVGDVSADPIVVRNVYYNYDQTKDGEQAESANLRLVKRGKETHGPDGTLDIIRSQVQYLEQLSAESKVLQAIMANEE